MARGETAKGENGMELTRSWPKELYWDRNEMLFMNPKVKVHLYRPFLMPSPVVVRGTGLLCVVFLVFEQGTDIDL